MQIAAHAARVLHQDPGALGLEHEQVGMGAGLHAVHVGGEQLGGEGLGVHALGRARRACEQVGVAGARQHRLEQLPGAGLIGQAVQGAHAGTCSRTRSATCRRLPAALARTTRWGYRSAASVEALRDRVMKGVGLALDPVAALTDPPGSVGPIELQQDRAIGQEPSGGGHVDAHHLVDTEAAGAALVGQRRVDVAVGDHHPSSLERGPDHGIDQLRARRGI